MAEGRERVFGEGHRFFRGEPPEINKEQWMRFIAKRMDGGKKKRKISATNLQAAIDVAHLKKLDSFMARRRENWAYLRKRLALLGRYLILPERETDTGPSWFGFLMTFSPESPVTRNAMVSNLEARNIQTRPLFAGNLTQHPCFQDLREGVGYRVAGRLEITDLVMNTSFWVGVYPGMERAMLEEIVRRIQEKFSTDVP